MGIQSNALFLVFLLVNPGLCSDSSIGDSGDILARDLSLDDSSLVAPDELSDFGPRPLSYGVRMAFSGASSSQSSTMESSASSGSFEKPDTVSQVYGGLSALGGMGGLLAGASVAYRNWKLFTGSLEAKKTREVILEVQDLPFSESQVRMEIRVDYTLEDDIDGLVARAVKALNAKLGVSKDFEGKHIEGARIFKRSESGGAAERIHNVFELREGETYLLAPSGVAVEQNHHACIQLERPCRPGDETTVGCQKPGDVVTYRDSSGKIVDELTIPPYEEWLKHTHVPVTKSAGKHQLVQIADRMTGTYCSLWVAVPAEAHLAPGRVVTNVYFIRVERSNIDGESEAEHNTQPILPYFKSHNSLSEDTIHY